jgi:hypothetical protein
MVRASKHAVIHIGANQLLKLRLANRRPPTRIVTFVFSFYQKQKKSPPFLLPDWRNSKTFQHEISSLQRFAFSFFHESILVFSAATTVKRKNQPFSLAPEFSFSRKLFSSFRVSARSKEKLLLLRRA